RHGDAQGRREVQAGRRRRAEERLRVGEVLRDLREVVRPEGRGAVPDDAAGEGISDEADREIVLHYTFKWSVLWSGQSASWLLQGLVTTLELSALAWLLAAFLGILSGALRTVAFKPLRLAAVFY